MAVRDLARSLNPVQWVMLAMTVPLTLVFGLQVVFDLPPVDLVVVGRALTAVGFPLMVWGTLPMLSSAFVPVVGVSRKRLPKAEQERLKRLVEERPRQWFCHIGFTLVFGGMIIYWPENTVGPALLNRPFQVLCIVLVVGYWTALPVSWRQARHRRRA